jgi:hypothetical protein
MPGMNPGPTQFQFAHPGTLDDRGGFAVQAGALAEPFSGINAPAPPVRALRELGASVVPTLDAKDASRMGHPHCLDLRYAYLRGECSVP